MLKVRDLIKLLQKENPDRVVVCAGDEEGNSYSPLRCVVSQAYCTKSRSIGMERLTAKDRAAGYSEEDVLTGGLPALVLYPE